MSKKTIKTFTIRGFDFETEVFSTPTGVIEDKSSFKEVVIDIGSLGYAGVESVTTMLTDPVIGTMSVPKIIETDGIVINGLTKQAESPENAIQIVDLKINLNLSDKLEVRNVKTTIREIIKRWAEKSRVKNRRGFRSSAIRTPRFDYKSNSTDVNVQVILSNAVIYSNSKVDVAPFTESNVLQDLNSLKKELAKRLDWKFNKVSYIHSSIGKGIL